MAERRMFAKSIVLSDAFLDMPLSARCLYFTLGMFADDDGFVGSPKGIMRQCGASEDDFKVLLAKRYILAFESGVIVIKHWRINNYLREDRHKSTTYLEEMDTLTVDSKGAYTEVDKFGIPTANQLPTTMGIPSIGKDSIDKDSIEEVEEEPKRKRFVPPTLEEVKAYCQERKNNVDPKRFFDYYQQGQWKDSKGNPVKNWKQKLITWENKQPKVETKKSWQGVTRTDIDFEELKRRCVVN
jgi:hypothetical protein